jgi:transcription antitermination factor NusA-like protein
MPTGKNPSVIIYSKTMAEFIKNILNMKDDESSVWVSDDLSNTQDVVTLEIKRG